VIAGSCLCGTVRFELDEAAGPFELCHCSRCRKVSGAAFIAALGVRREHFRWISGRDAIGIYDAPILEAPPAYRSCFCRRCGSTVPDPTDTSDWFEIPAGLLDGDPKLRPDKHIFIERKASWDSITDSLPQLDKAALLALRRSRSNA
jgi:hypothetical protein